VTAAGSSPRSAPTVCPFVALAEDRDRRADTPDERNRCYAERAPRRRDLTYQAEYCYSASFATCATFLAWAARNAAEPAYVTDAARAAWASGVAAPEQGMSSGEPAASRFAWGAQGPDAEPISENPTVEGGFFGPADVDAARSSSSTGEHDWVSASAWEAAPWDPLAEAEAAELEALAQAAEELAADEDIEPTETVEVLQGPKVPAALPLRRRQREQAPITSRGSGEWLYSDPIDRQPLATRRRSSGVGAPILLVVLGLLVVAIFVFLVPALLGGGTPAPAALASPTPASSARPAASRAPSRTSEPSSSPSLPPEPEIRVHTVRPGSRNGTLSGIAERYGVELRHLQCLNVITNPNVLQPGQKLLIPPDGFSCPSGWRNMTPPPIPED
jgi:LysM repeat protein